jgi:hypothetical protein
MQTGPGSETLRRILNNRSWKNHQKTDNSEGQNSLKHYVDVNPKFNYYARYSMFV